MAEKTPAAKIWKDPIVAEVRRAREAILADAGYDVRELCRRLAEKQEDSGHLVLRQPATLEMAGDG